MTTFYDRHRIPLRAFYTLICRIRIEGAEHFPSSGSVVVVSNHLTMLDPFLLGITFPRALHFMVKEELFRIKPLGNHMAKAGSFPVRRGESDRAALKMAETYLHAGEVVMIFPEGHRSAGRGAQAAQAGAVLLASRTNSLIVPVGIAGTEQLRPQAVIDRLRHGNVRRPQVIVSIGKPIDVGSGGRGSGKKAAADQVMRRILDLLPQEYHGVYGETATP